MLTFEVNPKKTKLQSRWQNINPGAGICTYFCIKKMKWLPEIQTTETRFRTSDEAAPLIRMACVKSAGLAAFHEPGVSEEGRPIYGVVIGSGRQTVSLIGGAHSDEPVGPETLRNLILALIHKRTELAHLFEAFRFVIVPHLNPDGEALNQAWINEWPSVSSYLKYTFREPPGRDLEFGFPGMRLENQAVASFLKEFAPMALHLSLHGMGFAEGVMLLIEKHWIERTKELQEAFVGQAKAFNLPLHDHDRNGEKGFIYIGPGFTTTPEGSAMREYFNQLGDAETAGLFHDSSMEFVRKLGGDPLCVVTEMPLFLLCQEVEDHKPGVPQVYLDFRAVLPELRLRLQRDGQVDDLLAPFRISPLSPDVQMQLQLLAIDRALDCIAQT